MVAGRIKAFVIGICILTALCVSVCSVSAQGVKEFYDKAKESLDKGLYDQAMAEINQAIQIYSTVAEFYTLRGALYRIKSDLGHAISDYSKSLELNPYNGDVYYYRAICYLFTKEYDKAWDDVHKAEKLGYAIFPGFIEDLRKASGRDK